MKKLIVAGCVVAVVLASEGRQPTEWERFDYMKDVTRVPHAAKVPFRLGVARWTYHTVAKEYNGLAKVLESMRKVDCHYLGLISKTLSYDASDAEIAQYKAFLASYGVETVTLGPDEVSADEAEARRIFEFAKRFGMKTVSLLPCEKKTIDGKEVDVESEAALDVVEKLVKEYDIRVAIHNHGPDMPNLYPTAEAIWKRIEKRDARIGFCFDIGHQYRAGHDPVAAIRKYGKRIYDVHLKNIKSHPVCNLATPGPRGELEIPQILQALADVGYDGVCHIEYERDFDDPTLGLAESMGYYRGVMDTLTPSGAGN